jgi:hypothetical protein
MYGLTFNVVVQVGARVMFSISVIQTGEWGHVCAELLQQQTHLLPVLHMARKRHRKPDDRPQNEK